MILCVCGSTQVSVGFQHFCLASAYTLTFALSLWFSWLFYFSICSGWHMWVRCVCVFLLIFLLKFLHHRMRKLLCVCKELIVLRLRRIFFFRRWNDCEVCDFLSDEWVGWRERESERKRAKKSMRCNRMFESTRTGNFLRNSVRD